MNGFHSKSVDEQDKFVDDVKKRIGKFRSDLDDELKKVSDKLDKKIDLRNELVDHLKNSLSNTDETISMLTSSVRSMKQVVSKNTEEVSATYHYENLFKDIDRTVKNMDSKYGNLLEKEKNHSESKNLEIIGKISGLEIGMGKNRESFLSVFSSVESMKQDFDLLGSMLSSLNEDVKNNALETGNVKAYSQNNYDFFRKLSDESNSFFGKADKKLQKLESDLVFLYDQMKKIQNSCDKSALSSDLKSLKDVVDLIPKTSTEEDFSSDWKHQMELKIARIEKIINS